MVVRRRATAVLNKEGRPARIAAGIGAARGKRIEPLLCVIKAVLFLLLPWYCSY